VVRDAKGQPVAGLKKDDFRLLDGGKPQVISRFSVEAGATAVTPENTPGQEKPVTPEGKVAAVTPQRFVVFLFDDVHLDFGSLSRARTAAEEYMATMRPSERAAVYTISGKPQMDFTDDRAKLQDTLNRIMPHPITNSLGTNTDCPQMTYYMAERIVKESDNEALRAATDDAADCEGLTSSDPGTEAALGPAAKRAAEIAAREKYSMGNYETQVTLDSLRQVVRRTMTMPGQRTMILVSPGFLNPEERFEIMRVEEQAVHAGIIINTLDARGLYTTGDDASVGTRPRHKQSFLAGTDEKYSQYARLALSEQSQVMRELADATGGKFYNNSNNLKVGFEQLAGTPEYAYLLAFSPPNLKHDGSFHSLKVTIPGQRYDIQARNGYFAPKHADSPIEEARRALEEEVFSREEIHEIPVQLHTEFFVANDQQATVSVLARVDARRLHFRKEEGRNRNDVTVVSALFDRNGKFVSGTEKVLQMRLRDETLDSNAIAGLTLKSSFDVKPGAYLVRLVVCDDNGRMAAQNDAVEIP